MFASGCCALAPALPPPPKTAAATSPPTPPPPAQLETRNDALETSLSALDARARALLPSIEGKVAAFNRLRDAATSSSAASL